MEEMSAKRPKETIPARPIDGARISCASAPPLSLWYATANQSEVATVKIDAIDQIRPKIENVKAIGIEAQSQTMRIPSRVDMFTKCVTKTNTMKANAISATRSQDRAARC